jgi:GxxExxY protein
MTFEEFRAQKNELDPELDRLTQSVIGACIEVHKELDPGLTENLYEEALCRELEIRGIAHQRQVVVPVIYKGRTIGSTRIDLIVENKLLVELKSCELLNQIHRAQCICYLRLHGLRLGLLVNFNVTILVDGVKRVILSG